MVVTNQAIFSVGDPQHETIGRTLQVPRMSESEVISAVVRTSVGGLTSDAGISVWKCVFLQRLPQTLTSLALARFGQLFHVVDPRQRRSPGW